MMKLGHKALTAFTITAASLVSTPAMADSLLGIDLMPIGVYHSGVFDESAAEIPAYDPASKRLFIVNATRGVDVLDIADPTMPKLAFTLDAPNTNSVTIANGLVALAVANTNTQANGTIQFFDTDGNFKRSVAAGALPDMLTFSPDYRYVVAANEGEPNSDYTIDPVGSVSIVDTTDYSTKLAVFDAFNSNLPDGVRVFGPGATAAQDFEPEYIAVSKDSTKAYVALQENNAIAVVDLATATVTDVVSLGTKDHSLNVNALDASNKDDAVNLATYPVKGLYMPDAISLYEVDGKSYLITANEGDSRDYDAFSEEARVADLTLDPTAFPNAAELQADEKLGRLKITTTLGDTDGDGDFDELYSYGGRSFSIFEIVKTADGTSLSQVFDSGSQFEQITAAALPNDFNSTNDENSSFDDRSDDKGPEPEGVSIGTVNGRTYAFIGLERVGGVMVYDITDPNAPAFIDYVNVRDFSIEELVVNDLANPLVGDLGPEGLLFISAEESPNGQDLLVVANEVSGSTRIFAVNSISSVVPSPTAAAAGLTLLAGTLSLRRDRADADR